MATFSPVPKSETDNMSPDEVFLEVGNKKKHTSWCMNRGDKFLSNEINEQLFMSSFPLLLLFFCFFFLIFLNVFTFARKRSSAVIFGMPLAHSSIPNLRISSGKQKRKSNCRTFLWTRNWNKRGKKTWNEWKGREKVEKVNNLFNEFRLKTANKACQTLSLDGRNHQNSLTLHSGR